MNVRGLVKTFMAAGIVLLAISGGLALAGLSIDEAAGQVIGQQAGSAELAPGLGAGAPSAGAAVGAEAAGADAADALPFTGVAAIPVAIAGMLLVGVGITLRRFA